MARGIGVNVIEPGGALREATTGRVRLEQGADGARLVGWAMEEPSMPGEAPEIAIQGAGLGLRSFGTEPAVAGDAMPEGAHAFAWPLPFAAMP